MTIDTSSIKLPELPGNHNDRYAALTPFALKQVNEARLEYCKQLFICDYDWEIANRGHAFAQAEYAAGVEKLESLRKELVRVYEGYGLNSLDADMTAMQKFAEEKSERLARQVEPIAEKPSGASTDYRERVSRPGQPIQSPYK